MWTLRTLEILSMMTQRINAPGAHDGVWLTPWRIPNVAFPLPRVMQGVTWTRHYSAGQRGSEERQL